MRLCCASVNKGGTVVPDDPDSDALLADLNTQLTVLGPEIQGLNDFISMSVSADLKAELDSVLTARMLRQSLIQTVIADLTALLADGYPLLPAIIVPESLFSELQEQNTALAAALAMFSDTTITAGPLSLTPNPTPPTKPGP